MRISFITLGCRMNQFDTALMMDRSLSAGYEVVGEGEKADVYVINTCTVTGGGDRASRQAIYRARRENPSAIVVATGCYAQVNPDEVGSLEEVDLVVGNTHKGELLKIIEDYIEDKSERVIVGEIFREKELKNFDTVLYFEGVRPFIKVQEGCNKFCSFCVIPYARGKVRSAPPEKVVEEVRLLSQKGFKEVVITGTQLSQYGWDIGSSLYSLLRELIKTPIELIRLSSMHIGELDAKTLELMCHEEKIATHFHLSLQSGSDRILELMRRGYTLEDYRRVVDFILSKRPESAIGTDLIVGFPGESEEDFGLTLRAVEEIPFAYLHLFPYSDRPRTPARNMDSKVPASIIKERMAILKKIDKELRETFKEKNKGRVLRGIVLGNGKILTENYIEVEDISGQSPGELVKVAL